MVTGDTSALDEGLNAAMKSVGMTHLTAVSGANCSLVLGALLLLCRRFRLPRLASAVLAVAGLGLFVLLVGPDASVLRAALMGAVAVVSLAAGRSGRGLSFLCLAVIGLLLTDPGLGSSFGFLLSVLATLGIIVLGQRIMAWTPAFIPRWAAAAVAVPLSAQLLCGPVIVVLQPQFSTYSLLANVLVSPLVAPVTLLGTAAVPLVVLVPWAGTLLIAVAGACSAGVAATARFTSQLPGAALPWPEGVSGMLTMLFLSVLTFVAVWAAVRPHRLIRGVLALHRRTDSLLEMLERYASGRLPGHNPQPLPTPAARVLPQHGPGLDRDAGHGRLGYSIKLSGRKPRWPLRRNVQPARRRRTAPPGGT
jgi:competence protein ComEC